MRAHQQDKPHGDEDGAIKITFGFELHINDLKLKIQVI
jgi:hypothetical protein